jgi:hypothetical protein
MGCVDNKGLEESPRLAYTVFERLGRPLRLDVGDVNKNIGLLHGPALA